MLYNVFQKTVMAGTPFDKGQMMDSWMFYDTPYYYLARADEGRTPYFKYNELGTIYSQRNKGFISKGITGQINRILYSESLGLPYSTEETNKVLAERNNSILLGVGAMEVIR